jgi:hypothetical protein
LVRSKRPRQLTRALCFVVLTNHPGMINVKDGSSDRQNWGSYDRALFGSNLFSGKSV